MPLQATKWKAQLKDRSILTGGGGYAWDVNVSAVQVDQIALFSVIHNEWTYTYYAPLNQWYKDGKPVNFTYPTQFRMADGSILTVDWNASTQRLALSQV